METLGRGLVAVKTAGGVFVSWRILGEEYYDVTYNLYRDGTKINAVPLLVSNYQDAGGTTASTYQVSAVVRGSEQTRCASVKVWSNSFLTLPLGQVYSRRGYNVTGFYEPNDASVADLDGDGEMEILLKRVNAQDDYDLFPTTNDSAFVQLEVYKMNGTKLWSIDCGPNMVSGTNVEVNIVAFDWDEDGKAEVLLRGADGMIIHSAAGDTVVGSLSVNTRNTIDHDANMTYTNTGNEYLIYLNGETGKPYQIMTYPLARGSASDWGDSYGHRSSKYFFGAPYLDGRKPSIFLARGIYSMHKMAAYDVDPATHTLKQRWAWDSSVGSAWFGQGYHNYGIADVDWDGRDEIVYGSMVIDDNGKGLSTTGLGHGDAQHCSDLDPYRHGQEIFACNESNPSCNYRDATTSKIYYRLTGDNDDGRAIAGNFTDNYPGAIAFSAHSGVIGCSSDKVLSDGTKTGTDENFRIYWDGDLCEETFNYTSCSNNVGVDGRIVKYGSWTPLTTFTGTYTNNGSKGTACIQADLFGDWREEVMVRDQTGLNLRIYTTTVPTPWRNYTLLHDMQYRQGVMWQMCGYNQPPHTSYYLGKLEGITLAPPPLMTNGRTLVANGGTIGSSCNDKHILLCETGDMQVAVADGAAPYITTINTPTWVQGSNNNSAIKTTTYTCTLTGGAFTGAMRLIKQGDGTLVLPAVTETYTGETNIWAGTLSFDGTLKNSALWLNRFAKLISNGGTFAKGIKMEYASSLLPGGEGVKGLITTDTLSMGFGSRLVLDLFSTDITADEVKADTLKIGTVSWSNGPAYSTPVIEFVQHNKSGDSKPSAGRYLVGEFAAIEGDIKSLVVEGLSGVNHELSYENGKLYLDVYDMREATHITWSGAQGNVWDFAQSSNFVNDSTGTADSFVTGDRVLFDDNASAYSVSLAGELNADSVVVNSSKAYTFAGTGFVGGSATLLKQGSGLLTISNANSYTGGTILNGGTTRVSLLSNAYSATGNLGGITTTAARFVMQNGAVLQTTADVEMGSPIKIGTGGATLNNAAAFVMDKLFTGTILTKTGSGNLKLNATNSLKKIVVGGGTVTLATDGVSPADTVEFQGGALQDFDNSYSYSGSSFVVSVPAGKSGKWNLDGRCNYTNRLVGSGTLTVYIPYVRTYLQGNWSAFTGTVKATAASGDSFTFDNSYGLPEATLDLSSGVYVANSGKSFTIGKVTGSGTLGGLTSGYTSGSNTWKIGNATDYEWGGIVSGNGTSFVKVGSGTLTLTGVHNFTGTATISEGTVLMRSGSQLGTGTLTVAQGATLMGVSASSGALANSSYTINGTLQAGVTSTALLGSLDMGGKNVTFNATSTYRVGLRRCASGSTTGGTCITDIANLRMNGTVEVYLYSGYTPVEGDSMRIWSCNSFSGTPKLSLPQLPSGYGWDSSRIGEGLLFITYDPTGIQGVKSDEAVTVTVSTMGGVKVATWQCAAGEVSTAFLQNSALPAGSYLLHIQARSGWTVKKMVKR